MLNLRKRSIYSRHKVLFIWAGIVVEVVILAALVVLAVVVFGSVYFRVVEHPKFCGSVCHNMNASYESFKRSAHSGVHCAKCHSREGFVDGFLKDTIYAAGKEVFIYMEGEEFYDMDEVHPKVYDEGCLRHGCHNVETLVEKKNLFMTDNIFGHSKHISASSEGHSGGPATAEAPSSSLVLNCTSCHSQSKEKHMVVDNRVCFLCHFDSEADASTMQECQSCHAIPVPVPEHEMADEEGIESCNDCHAIEAKDIKVLSEKCAECHEGEKEPLDANSAHKLHVSKQEARCMECHDPIEHGL